MAHPQSGGPSLPYLPLAAGDWIVGPRAGAMTGRMTLGTTIVWPLAAVAGTEVRVAKGRRRRNRQSAYGERQGQHLPTHGYLLNALIAPTGLPDELYSEPPLLADRSTITSAGSSVKPGPAQPIGIADHYKELAAIAAAPIIGLSCRPVNARAGARAGPRGPLRT